MTFCFAKDKFDKELIIPPLFLLLKFPPMAEITVLPPITDRRWSDVATGKVKKPWTMLAAKILITRVNHVTMVDPSPATVQKSAQEVRAFFEKNIKAAQKDIALLLD